MWSNPSNLRQSSASALNPLSTQSGLGGPSSNAGVSNSANVLGGGAASQVLAHQQFVQMHQSTASGSSSATLVGSSSTGSLSGLVGTGSSLAPGLAAPHSSASSAFGGIGGGPSHLTTLMSGNGGVQTGGSVKPGYEPWTNTGSNRPVQSPLNPPPSNRFF